MPPWQDTQPVDKQRVPARAAGPSQAGSEVSGDREENDLQLGMSWQEPCVWIKILVPQVWIGFRAIGGPVFVPQVGTSSGATRGDQFLCRRCGKGFFSWAGGWANFGRGHLGFDQPPKIQEFDPKREAGRREKAGWRGPR